MVEMTDYKIPKDKKKKVTVIDSYLDEAISKSPDTFNDAWKRKIIYDEKKEDGEKG